MSECFTEKKCPKCERKLMDIYFLFLKKYRGLRAVPTSAIDHYGNNVCLLCSPDNVLFNLDYDWDSEENPSEHLS